MDYGHGHVLRDRTLEAELLIQGQALGHVMDTTTAPTSARHVRRPGRR